MSKAKCRYMREMSRVRGALQANALANVATFLSSPEKHEADRRLASDYAAKVEDYFLRILSEPTA